MKRIYMLLAATVLTAAALTGCGCRNTKPAVTTAPTTLPVVTTVPVPTTRPTTVPTVPAETATDATIEDGNGPLPTDPVDTTAATDAARSMPVNPIMPRNSGIG